jgi:hypothetical protein
MKWNVKKKRSECNNLAADWLVRNRNVPLTFWIVKTLKALKR